MPEVQTPPAPHLSQKQLAKRLSLSRASIRRLTASGKIPRPLKLNHTLRWPISVIEQWEKSAMEAAK